MWNFFSKLESQGTVRNFLNLQLMRSLTKMLLSVILEKNFPLHFFKNINLEVDSICLNLYNTK
jgi:hypothetical protein